MPPKLTTRQYAWVRCLLIAAHVTTFFSSIFMLIVPLVDRRGYQEYFRIVKVRGLGVSFTSDFMVTSGTLGLLQPLLFLGIHIVYPLFRQRQLAKQDAARRLNAGAEQHESLTQRKGSSIVASSAHNGSLMNLQPTPTPTMHGSHLYRPLSSLHATEESASQGNAGCVTGAASSSTSRKATATSNPLSCPPRLGPSNHGLRLSLSTSLGSPRWTPRQLPWCGMDFSSSSLPKNRMMSPVKSCSTTAHTPDLRISSGRSVVQTATSVISTVPPALLSASATKEPPMDAAVASARQLVHRCYLPVDVSQVVSSAEVGGAVKSHEAHVDVSAAVSKTAAATGHAEAAEGIPVRSEGAFPRNSDAIRAMVDTSSGVTTCEFDGNASKLHHRSVSNMASPRALVTSDDVDDSAPVFPTTSAQHSGAASQPNTPLVKGAADRSHTPATALAESSMPARTQPPSSALPSDAGDTTRFQLAHTTVSSSSKPPAGENSAMIHSTVVSHAAPVREGETPFVSSEEVQPPKMPASPATQHSLSHLDFLGSTRWGSSASALSRRLPWFMPTTVAPKAPPLPEQSPRLPSASRLRTSVRPLPPALLHAHFKTEPTFRSLLTTYYVFTAVGILLMYYFGVFWIVRKELHEMKNLALITEGWNRLFVYPMSASTDAGLCSMQLRRRCSGGSKLCNATYVSADDAHDHRCPFCSASQQERIRKFTDLCSVAYNPGTRYSTTFILFLSLSVLTSLVSLFLAVFSCGKGVLASVNYAAHSERDMEAGEKTRTMLEPGSLLAVPESLTALQSSHPPSLEFQLSAAGEALSPTTPTIVTPSRERLLHTFEGLHEPSPALLPPLSVVMAEMSDGSGAPAMWPVNVTRGTCSLSTEKAHDVSAQAMVDGVDGAIIPTNT
ncbi:hypothetical protein JKF63_02231 [Porcisia hertigi]|uniref:Uncharacterized protein n=1 Tax=Porcisia hertigi TaxID=2761500 RepID=A0A836IDD2_9TRYP|nr:hypothetical protein JKF63_02231 [Porcisia hertigi]